MKFERNGFPSSLLLGLVCSSATPCKKIIVLGDHQFLLILYVYSRVLISKKLPETFPKTSPKTLKHVPKTYPPNLPKNPPKIPPEPPQ